MSNTTKKEILTSDIENLKSMMSEIPKFRQDSSVEENLKKAIPRVNTLDFMKIRAEAHSEAKQMIESIVRYYVDSDVAEHDIVKSMILSDIQTVSELIVDMKTSEHIMEKVCMTIDTGDINPKLLESYTKMQDSKMNIIKHLKQVEMLIRSNYSKFQTEHAEKERMEQLDQEHHRLIDGGNPTLGLLGQVTNTTSQQETPELTITSQKTVVKAKPRVFAQQMQKMLSDRGKSSNNFSKNSDKKTDNPEEASVLSVDSNDDDIDDD